MSTTAWILVCSLLVVAAGSVIVFVVCATVCTEKKKKKKPVYDVLPVVVTKHILQQYTKDVSDGISKNFKDYAKFEKKERPCTEHLLETDTRKNSENTFKVTECSDLVKGSHVNEHESEDVLAVPSNKLPEQKIETCEVSSSSITQKKTESILEPKVSIVPLVKAARICKEVENRNLKAVFSPQNKESLILPAGNEITSYPIEGVIPGACGGSSTGSQQACGDSSTGSQQEDRRSNERLDWNQIFSFLAENMPPRNYFIFFMHLFDNGRAEGYSGGSTHNILERLDHDLKGMETQTRLVRYFHEWKLRLGNKARISHIIKSLSKMGYIDVVESLEEYQKTLPLLPEQSSNTERPHNVLSSPSTSSLVPFRNLQMQEQMFQQCQFQSYGDGKKMLVHQSQEARAFSSLSVGSTKSNEHEHQPVTHMHNIRRGKRHWSETDSSSEGDSEYIRSKNRRICYNGRRSGRSSYKSSKQTRSNFPNKCNKLVSWKDITYSNYINLLKKVMSTCKSVEANNYFLFMQHTVQMILMKNREKSEEEVLSMTCDEFNQYEEKHSKSGEVKYEIDTRYGFLILGDEEWDYLNLYKQQRDNICQEKLLKNSAFVSSIYVFIDYDGQPVQNQYQTENEGKAAFGETEDITNRVPTGSSVQIGDVQEDRNIASDRQSDEAKQNINSEIKYQETPLQTDISECRTTNTKSKQ